MTARGFYVVAGAVLVLVGLIQIVMGAPQNDAARRLLSPRALWPALCVALGLAVILAGAGVLPRPGP